jgi:hypothetical protein
VKLGSPVANSQFDIDVTSTTNVPKVRCLKEQLQPFLTFAKDFSVLGRSCDRNNGRRFCFDDRHGSESDFQDRMVS